MYVYFFADDPNCMWEIWKNLFLEVLDKHAPLQRKKSKIENGPLDYKWYEETY